MKRLISGGNRKLGLIPNFSLTPGISCNPEACKYCFKDCYNQKAMRMYKDVRERWAMNTDLAINHLDQLEQELMNYFEKMNAPKFFRIHVAGDFFSVPYTEMWIRIATVTPDTKFLAFTKQFSVVNQVEFPSNFTLVLSAWPGMDIPENLRQKYHIAWMQDGTETRIPEGTIECPGHCDNCGMCWDIGKTGHDVMFHKH